MPAGVHHPSNSLAFASNRITRIFLVQTESGRARGARAAPAACKGGPGAADRGLAQGERVEALLRIRRALLGVGTNPNLTRGELKTESRFPMTETHIFNGNRRPPSRFPMTEDAHKVHIKNTDRQQMNAYGLHKAVLLAVPTQGTPTMSVQFFRQNLL